MNNEMPPKVQCGEHPFVGFANGLSAHRGWRVLRHEHRICTVKFKNAVDIFICESLLVHAEQILKLPFSVFRLFRWWSTLFSLRVSDHDID